MSLGVISIECEKPIDLLAVSLVSSHTVPAQSHIDEIDDSKRSRQETMTTNRNIQGYGSVAPFSTGMEQEDPPAVAKDCNLHRVALLEQSSSSSANNQRTGRLNSFDAWPWLAIMH